MSGGIIIKIIWAASVTAVAVYTLKIWKWVSEFSQFYWYFELFRNRLIDSANAVETSNERRKVPFASAHIPKHGATPCLKNYPTFIFAISLVSVDPF